jgi:hypothetical protein
MIPIGENYRVVSDEYQVILQKKFIRKNKAGEEYETWENDTYHANYEQALEYVVDKGIRGCDTLFEVVEKIIELKKMIKDLKLPKR